MTERAEATAPSSPGPFAARRAWSWLRRAASVGRPPSSATGVGTRQPDSQTASNFNPFSADLAGVQETRHAASVAFRDVDRTLTTLIAGTAQGGPDRAALEELRARVASLGDGSDQVCLANINALRAAETLFETVREHEATIEALRASGGGQ